MAPRYPGSRVLAFDGSSMLPNNGNHNSRQDLVPMMGLMLFLNIYLHSLESPRICS